MRNGWSAAVAVVAVVVCGGCSLRAQIVDDERNKVLTSARSRYYNPMMAGADGFQCDVRMNWAEFFRSLGSELPADNPVLAQLNQVHYSFTDELKGKTTADWSVPDGVEKPADKVADLLNSLKPLLDGFLQAWNPSLSGRLISMAPKSLTKTGTGYLLDDSESEGKDLIVLSDDLTITHMTAITSKINFEGDTSFEASPVGLVMTRMDAITRQPPEAQPIHIVMATTYAPVGRFSLPASLRVEIPNTAVFAMKFENCTVKLHAEDPDQGAPKPAAGAKPAETHPPKK